MLPRFWVATIELVLPPGFQTSEFLLEKGMLDLVVDRREMKAVIAKGLRFMGAAAPVVAATSAEASVAPIPEPAPQG